MRSLQGRRCGSSDMLHNRHACCGFAAFYSLGFAVLRSGRGHRIISGTRSPPSSLVCCFHKKRKTLGKSKAAKRFGFSDSSAVLVRACWLVIRYTKNVPKMTDFWRAINKGFLVRKNIWQKFCRGFSTGRCEFSDRCFACQKISHHPPIGHKLCQFIWLEFCCTC